MRDYWYTYSIDWNDTDFLHLEILKKNKLQKFTNDSHEFIPLLKFANASKCIHLVVLA